MRCALRGPAHQLGVRMRINNCTHGYNNSYGPSNQLAIHHVPATASAPRVCTLVPFIGLGRDFMEEVMSTDSLCSILCYVECFV